MAVVLKIAVQRLIHRIRLEAAPTYDDVDRTIRELCPCGGGARGCALATYSDEDGDACVLTRMTFTDFLETAREARGRACPVLRLEVHPQPTLELQGDVAASALEDEAVVSPYVAHFLRAAGSGLKPEPVGEVSELKPDVEEAAGVLPAVTWCWPSDVQGGSSSVEIPLVPSSDASYRHIGFPGSKTEHSCDDSWAYAGRSGSSMNGEDRIPACPRVRSAESAGQASELLEAADEPSAAIVAELCASDWSGNARAPMGGAAKAPVTDPAAAAVEQNGTRGSGLEPADASAAVADAAEKAKEAGEALARTLARAKEAGEALARIPTRAEDAQRSAGSGLETQSAAVLPEPEVGSSSADETRPAVLLGTEGAEPTVPAATTWAAAATQSLQTHFTLTGETDDEEVVPVVTRGRACLLSARKASETNAPGDPAPAHPSTGLREEARRARRAPRRRGVREKQRRASAEAVVHMDHICDNCGACPLPGPRFTCRVCDFDLCSVCYPDTAGLHAEDHGPAHRFRRVRWGQGVVPACLGGCGFGVTGFSCHPTHCCTLCAEAPGEHTEVCYRDNAPADCDFNP